MVTAALETTFEASHGSEIEVHHLDVFVLVVDIIVIVVGCVVGYYYINSRKITASQTTHHS